MKKPIEALTEAQVLVNHKIVGAIGRLCMIFGSFVLLMTALPNQGIKRLAFVFCGSLIFGVGWFLSRVSAKMTCTASQPNPRRLSRLLPIPNVAYMNNAAFHPGELWPDNNGVHINAHGGGILFDGGVYYWFGEHKIAGDAGNQSPGWRPCLFFNRPL